MPKTAFYKTLFLIETIYRADNHAINFNIHLLRED